MEGKLSASQASFPSLSQMDSSCLIRSKKGHCPCFRHAGMGHISHGISDLQESFIPTSTITKRCQVYRYVEFTVMDDIWMASILQLGLIHVLVTYLRSAFLKDRLLFLHVCHQNHRTSTNTGSNHYQNPNSSLSMKGMSVFYDVF